MGVLFAAIHVSCGAVRPSQQPGSSEAAFGAPTNPTATPKPAPQPYPNWASVSSWPALTEAQGTEPSVTRFASLGHGGGRYSYSVHVEPQHERAYRELVAEHPFPAGATLWVQLFDAKSGDLGPIYVMHKADTKWDFTQLNAAGLIVKGAVETCRRCHSEAPTDHLFGLPRSH